MNPGIAPSGLFWTAALPEDAVDVDFEDGTAVMRASNLQILDFGTIANALFGGGPPPVPATVSFVVRWSEGAGGEGEGEEDLDRVHVVNASDGHAGVFVRNTAQMEWSATVGDFDFVSAPIDTSSSSFAEVGHERNGTFFSDD
jgi:hypothetical protein